MKKISILTFCIVSILLAATSCKKDDSAQKTPVEYELVFTDIDGAVYRSSELLAGYPKEVVYEGAYYEGGKCVMNSAEDENLMCNAYREYIDSFNQEYGAEVGTYAFVPANSTAPGESKKTDTGSSLLPEDLASEARRVFTEIRDEWLEEDPEGMIGLYFQEAWIEFDSATPDYAHFNTSVITFLTIAQCCLAYIDTLLEDEADTKAIEVKGRGPDWEGWIRRMQRHNGKLASLKARTRKK